jgi:hypothetical protein
MEAFRFVRCESFPEGVHIKQASHRSMVLGRNRWELERS